MEQRPIFIGGADRSGKTYMRLMLTFHPNIALTRRTNLWPYFYNRYGDLSREANLERCLTGLLRYKHVAYLKPDVDRLRRDFWQGPPTYARLFGLIQAQHAEREGKPRWGDQTGLIERYADEIFAAYPAARLIHLIRDPRDRYEALLARAPQRRGRVGGAMAQWLYSVSLARRNLQKYPDQYLVMHYETMVMQPEATLHRVCDFIDEAYVPAMLTMPGVLRFQDKASSGANSDIGQSPLSTEFIGRYRQAIPKREIAFIQRYADREMLGYDYALDALQLSMLERLRFSLVDSPINLSWLFLWRAREAIQQRFPAQIGRQPASRKAKQRPNSKFDEIETV